MQGPRVSTALRVSSCIGLSLVVSCEQASPPLAQREDPSSGAATPEPARAPAQAPEPAVAPIPEALASPGTDALLLLTATKLLRFDGTELREVETPAGPLLDLFVDAEGRLYLLTATALFEARGEGFIEVGGLAKFDAGLAELGELRGALRHPSGTFYLRASGGIAWGGEQGWEQRSAVQLGYAGGTSLELGYDASGRAWVIGPERAIYRGADAQEWQETSKSTQDQGFEFGNARASSTGLVHVNNNHRLTRIHPDFLDSVLIDAKREQDYELLALSPSGDALVATRECELARVSARPPTKIWRFAARDYICAHAEAVALDEQGRAWVASREGLSAITDARALSEHTRAELPGFEGVVLRVVLLGTLPR